MGAPGWRARTSGSFWRAHRFIVRRAILPTPSLLAILAMPNDRRKFRTTHKFGKKRKKCAQNRKKSSLEPTAVTLSPLAAPESTTPMIAEAANEVAAGIDAPATGVADNTPASRVRLDTVYLSSADKQNPQQQADEKTEELGSVSATERKMKLLAPDCSAPSSSSTKYTVVDLRSVNDLLCFAECRVCKGAVSVERDVREFGIAVKLRMRCINCGELGTEWSSRRLPGPANCSPFEINVLAARVMQSTGNGQTALNDIFSSLGISHRGLHNKTFQHYLKTKLNPAAKSAC